jgi:hypothetical protein
VHTVSVFLASLPGVVLLAALSLAAPMLAGWWWARREAARAHAHLDRLDHAHDGRRPIGGPPR